MNISRLRSFVGIVGQTLQKSDQIIFTFCGKSRLCTKATSEPPLSADDDGTDPEIVSALSAFASFVLALMRSQASTNGCSNRDGADGEAAKDRRLQAIRLEGRGELSWTCSF